MPIEHVSNSVDNDTNTTGLSDANTSAPANESTPSNDQIRTILGIEEKEYATWQKQTAELLSHQPEALHKKRQGLFNELTSLDQIHEDVILSSQFSPYFTLSHWFENDDFTRKTLRKYTHQITTIDDGLQKTIADVIALHQQSKQLAVNKIPNPEAIIEFYQKSRDQDLVLRELEVSFVKSMRQLSSLRLTLAQYVENQKIILETRKQLSYSELYYSLREKRINFFAKQKKAFEPSLQTIFEDTEITPNTTKSL